MAAFIATMTLTCIVGAAFQNDSGLSRLVQVLGSDASSQEKQEASRALVKAGVEAIPVLIGALGDRRVYERRDIANRMNLPPNTPAPDPVMATITMGSHCEDLLYQIITPRHASSFAGNFKVFSEQVLLVDDWQKWWEANREKSLEQIHAELRPLVDEYWRQHGTTQSVAALPDVPARWEDGFPIPQGARRIDSLSSATSVEGGRNYSSIVYEIDATIDRVTAFYDRCLSGAARSVSAGEVRFNVARGFVRIVRAGELTRITLASGPK